MIKTIAIFCLLTLFACSENNKESDRILSEDEMTNILLDIYITEAKVINYSPRLPRDSSLLVFDTLKSEVLKKYNLTDSTFRKNLRYYFQRPEDLNTIYGRVIDSLNLKVQKNEVQNTP